MIVERFSKIVACLCLVLMTNIGFAQQTQHPTSVAIGLGVLGLLAWNPMQLDGVGLESGQDNQFNQTSMLWLWRINEPLFALGPLTLRGHWELSLGQVGPQPPNVLVAITPVLEWRSQAPSLPYLITGIGATWLSATEQGDHQFSTHFQFNERLGLGLDLGRITLLAQFQHHSNADVITPNNGYNFYNIGVKYWY